MAISIPAPEPIHGEEDLYALFHRSEKPRRQWRVGTEAEKFGIFEATGAPFPYEGKASIQRIFGVLAEDFGWRQESEYENGANISLLRDSASITLEPGAQLELSAAPHRTIHETREAFDEHLAELADISAKLGVRWLGLGFHPLAAQADLPWVPKLRYGVMREYLPTRGEMALDMMRRTCTVQANVDYESEADAMRKMRVSLRISPIVTAIFANSPYVEGKRSSDLTRRGRVWLHMDPDRTGLLPFAWSEKASYRDYVEWALDVPMFMVKRGARVVHNTGQTFRSFLREGAHGEYATMGDWESHLATLFPEVRLKRTLEMRSADSQRAELTCALPALWKGLLYDARSLDALDALTASWTHDDVAAIRSTVAERALGAELAGKPLSHWAQQIVDLAMQGLERIGDKDADGRDERIHLAPVADLVGAAQTPAEKLLAAMAKAPDFRIGLLEYASV